jgi:hypothetical protein
MFRTDADEHVTSVFPIVEEETPEDVSEDASEDAADDSAPGADAAPEGEDV